MGFANVLSHEQTFLISHSIAAVFAWKRKNVPIQREGGIIPTEYDINGKFS